MYIFRCFCFSEKDEEEHENFLQEIELIDCGLYLEEDFQTVIFKMRKKGPCFHCGVDSTPLWRNGPPEKPVLCNACGSRYRLGKPLENYTPKNAHAIRRKKRKPMIFPSEGTLNNVTNIACYSPLLLDYASSESSTSHDHNHNPFKTKQEIQDDNIYPVENWGSFWSPQVPSRKRSPVVYNSLTTIQKLQRDLHNVLRDEGGLSKVEGPDAEDVLIYDIDINKLQIPSTEIGLGSILLKFPVTDNSHDQIEPCPPNICANDAQKASPSLTRANASSDGVKARKNEKFSN